MKNTEIDFYSFKQFGYFSLHIGGNGNSAEVFSLFPMHLKDKAFKYLKNQSFFYLSIARDDDDDYIDREPSDGDYYEYNDEDT